jgi:hypothetical protein
VLLLPMSLELIQLLHLLRTLRAGVNVRFTVVSQAMIPQVAKHLVAICAEVAGESVNRRLMKNASKSGKSRWNSSFRFYT